MLNPLTIINGDALQSLKGLEGESVHCCVTSPPYWKQRNYGHASQIGREPTPAAFVDRLADVFDEVRRVLRPDGTCWVNINDTYANDGKWGGSSGNRNYRSAEGGYSRDGYTTGLPPKSLCLIPARFALALQDRGWIVRCDLIWEKPNGLPEKVADRPTRNHEYLFLLTKKPHYYFDASAIQEESAPSSIARAKYNNGKPSPKNLSGVAAGVFRGPVSTKKAYGQGRNKRSVWSVATQQLRDEHYAAYPENLIKPCIEAGCPAGGTVLDPFGGSGTTGRVALELGRRAIVIELNPTYIPLIERRCTTTIGLPLADAGCADAREVLTPA
jgi:DNA modification methylase